MKLFKLTLGNRVFSYVVADDSKKAEEVWLKYIKEKNWYFIKDRYISEVLFIAEEGDYPLGNVQLFVQK